MPRATIKRIHVDQHVIRANAKRTSGWLKPPLTVQNRGRSHKAFEVEIQGPSVVVYRDEPLSCGARCWIETTAPVQLDGGDPLL